MARLICYGNYLKDREEMTYRIADLNGKTVAELKSGDRYYISDRFYYKIEEETSENGSKILVAYNRCKNLDRVVQQPLLDNVKICLATTAKTAMHSLYTMYKKPQDMGELTDVLSKFNFIPQFIDEVEELADEEIDIKSNYIKICPNFDDKTKWYDYEVYSDSTDISDIVVTPENCVYCSIKRKETSKEECPKMKITYRKYYNGTYVFIIRKEVCSGIKQLVRVIITSDVDKSALAKEIEIKMS